MSEFTRWQMLNEALGFPLGVKSAQSLGIAGFHLEEKKKKMGVGDEIAPPDDDDEDELDVDDEDEDEDDKPELPVDDDKPDDAPDADKPPCSCGKPDIDDKGFCKKCKKRCKKNAKKHAKKALKKEDVFGSYEDSSFQEMPEVGSEEYRQAFLKSLEDHFGDPKRRHGGGVNLEEEVVFEPQDNQSPLTEPKPGEAGFAPQTRIGGELGGQDTPPKADWEKQWQQVGEQFVEFLASKDKK